MFIPEKVIIEYHPKARSYQPRQMMGWVHFQQTPSEESIIYIIIPNNDLLLPNFFVQFTSHKVQIYEYTHAYDGSVTSFELILFLV